jgi:multiple sugar transport system ATP-binding protein
MNFLEGELTGGRFVHPEGSFAIPIGGNRTKATAGLRPEDCRITAPGGGRVNARVYALELIGDHSLITCQFGDSMITVKADKAAHHEMDEPIGIEFKDTAVFLFDTETGERIRA